jgi:hypothetical protein
MPSSIVMPSFGMRTAVTAGTLAAGTFFKTSKRRGPTRAGARNLLKS